TGAGSGQARRGARAGTGDGRGYRQARRWLKRFIEITRPWSAPLIIVYQEKTIRLDCSIQYFVMRFT
ncbi:hypothetical protein O1L52_27125, partial [Pseudomonas aeruginosa]|uniref:hypothetical protein n=1 Tax=Pseudomonas aeruginosa TaxID=287 RepID=UPI002FF10AF9